MEDACKAYRGPMYSHKAISGLRTEPVPTSKPGRNRVRSRIRITKRQNRIADYGMEIACQARADVGNVTCRRNRWQVACVASEKVLFSFSQACQGDQSTLEVRKGRKATR